MALVSGFCICVEGGKRVWKKEAEVPKLSKDALNHICQETCYADCVASTPDKNQCVS